MNSAVATRTARYLPSSSTVLFAGGVILVGLGLYFMFVRPALLPEDPRYMGTSLEQIQDGFPGLLLWLPRVFLVLGGYMASTGILTCYLAKTSFRNRAAGVVWVVALTGLMSIGLMAMVNFIIGSDFKWLLLLFTLPWVSALWLFYHENRCVKTKIG